MKIKVFQEPINTAESNIQDWLNTLAEDVEIIESTLDITGCTVNAIFLYE